jgi:23S rRNA (uracil1939-C5)-methyltransferase
MNERELVIASLAAGGDGVARDADGRVTFVAGAAPGDRLLVDIVEERKSFARARLVRVVEAGPGRVEPRCPLFVDRSCGGCQWQHLSSEVQAAAKTEVVAGALRHFVGEGLEIDALLSPVPGFGWRRRARFHWVRPRRAAAAMIGFHGPGSHRVVNVTACPQLEPAVEQALAVVREILAPKLTGSGELEVVAGHGGEVHVAVRGPCQPRAVAALVDHAAITGARLGKQAWGQGDIELEPGLRGRADWFAQPSQSGNRALVDAVTAATAPRSGLNIVELFAGAGNFSRVLGEDSATLVAVDTGPGPKVYPGGASFRQGPAAAMLQEMKRRRETYDLAVLDPPRAGAAEVIAPLVALAPQRIVYVSCSPATLARDLATLAAAGYRATRAQPFDLMPQTAHVEVVVTLIREAAAKERTDSQESAGTPSATP